LRTVPLLILFTVLAIAGFAEAKQCSQVHGFHRSIFHFPEVLRDIHNETVKLTELLYESPRPDLEKIAAAVEKIDNATLDYLQFAGFDIIQEKTRTPFDINGLKFTVPHSVFRIRGRLFGDEASKMIFGAQFHAIRRGQVLQVEVDTMTGLARHSRGTFFGNLNMVLIQPRTFLDFLIGVRSTLRHELQHYYESVKMNDGRMSLGRLELYQYNAVDPNKPYGFRFSAEEIEAQLRELRVFQSWQNSKEKEHQLREIFRTDDRIANIRAEQLESAIYTKNLSFRMLRETRAALAVLKEAATNPIKKWHEVVALDSVQVAIHLPKDAEYSILLIDVTHILKEKELTDHARVREVLFTIIEHAEHRMAKIEEELLRRSLR